jgi:hypothetical protein
MLVKSTPGVNFINICSHSQDEKFLWQMALGKWSIDLGKKATYLANFSQKLCQYDVGDN